jgi:RNA polymerase sigma factor (sigma-70 family)
MTSPSTVLLRTQSDERLVALARAGHERAFEAIVERYRKPLLRACRRILPEARAEDALQHTLVAAWRGLERGDEVRELRPWLYRIARNTSLNQLRVAGYDLDELMETLTAVDDPEEEVLRRAVVRQTLAAVAALPDRQREALLRTAVNGHGQDEVARDLGLSSTAMRQLVHRARVSVRAAATAVVPLPVATWLAAGAGGAGTAATLAKAGTLVVLAGGAVSAPALIEHGPPTPRHRAEAHAAEKPKTRHEAAPTPTATATVVAARLVATATATPERVVAAVSTPRPTSRSSDEDGDHSNRGSGGDDRDREHEVEHSNRGPGGGDDRDGDDDHEGNQEPVATPAPTPEAETEHEAEDHSGHGSGESGETSGSGSGKDSSGSGDEPDD